MHWVLAHSAFRAAVLVFEYANNEFILHLARIVLFSEYPVLPLIIYRLSLAYLEVEQFASWCFPCLAYPLSSSELTEKYAEA